MIDLGLGEMEIGGYSDSRDFLVYVKFVYMCAFHTKQMLQIVIIVAIKINCVDTN